MYTNIIITTYKIVSNSSSKIVSNVCFFFYSFHSEMFTDIFNTKRHESPAVVPPVKDRIIQCHSTSLHTSSDQKPLLWNLIPSSINVTPGQLVSLSMCFGSAWLSIAIAQTLLPWWLMPGPPVSLPYPLSAFWVRTLYHHYCTVTPEHLGFLPAGCSFMVEWSL